jgi:hypothetical protein
VVAVPAAEVVDAPVAADVLVAAAATIIKATRVSHANRVGSDYFNRVLPLHERSAAMTDWSREVSYGW